MIARRVSAVLLAAVVLSGCSARPEETLISDFFAASRLRDLTALARIGTVVFEPRERGTITTFTIRSVSVQDGERDAAVKDVVIDAPVRLPDGSTVAKVLTVTLQRRPTSGGRDPSALYGGWIVTAVTDAVPSPSSPRS
jgi:hypothetical protein